MGIVLDYQSPGWRYLVGAAPAGWEQPGFDDSGWSVGAAAFGNGVGTIPWPPSTVWPTGTALYLRHPLAPTWATDFAATCDVDDDAYGYIDGVFRWHRNLLDPQVPLTSPPGTLLAVHCTDIGGGTFFDLQIVQPDPSRWTVGSVAIA